MGKPVSRRMLSAVRRLWGHRSTGPTAVLDQSMERISAPISPPPDRTVFRSECVIWARRLCCTNLRREKSPVSRFCQSATKNAIPEAGRDFGDSRTDRVAFRTASKPEGCCSPKPETGQLALVVLSLDVMASGAMPILHGCECVAPGEEVRDVSGNDHAYPYTLGSQLDRAGGSDGSRGRERGGTSVARAAIDRADLRGVLRPQGKTVQPDVRLQILLPEPIARPGVRRSARRHPPEREPLRLDRRHRHRQDHALPDRPRRTWIARPSAPSCRIPSRRARTCSRCCSWTSACCRWTTSPVAA